MTEIVELPLASLLSEVIDNRGKTCPTADTGTVLIATNCIKNEQLYPIFEKVRFVSQDTYDNWFRGHPKPGDLIFVTKGTPGRVCVSPDPVNFCIAQDMVALRADSNKIDPKFLFAVLRSPAVQSKIENMHVGTLIPHFKKGDFDKLLLPVPDRRSQEFIGGLYHDLCKKIDVNQRLCETLEQIARATFKSWFVDFDPLKAKTTNDNYDNSDPATVAMYPNGLIESELGRIPDGWELGNVYQVSQILYGAPFKSSLFNENGLGKPLIRIRDLATHAPVNFTTEDHPRGYLVQPGDLIVGMDGEFRAHLWRGPESWLNQRLCCFKPNPGVPRAFVHYSIETLLDFFERSKTGTTVIHLGKSDIDTFRLVIPPKAILERFGSLVDPLETRIIAAAQESRTLKALRDALLPRLLSGGFRLRAYDAGRFTETAL